MPQQQSTKALAEEIVNKKRAALASNNYLWTLWECSIWCGRSIKKLKFF